MLLYFCFNCALLYFNIILVFIIGNDCIVVLFFFGSAFIVFLNKKELVCTIWLLNGAKTIKLDLCSELWISCTA